MTFSPAADSTVPFSETVQAHRRLRSDWSSVLMQALLLRTQCIDWSSRDPTPCAPRLLMSWMCIGVP